MSRNYIKFSYVLIINSFTNLKYTKNSIYAVTYYLSHQSRLTFMLDV